MYLDAIALIKSHRKRSEFPHRVPKHFRVSDRVCDDDLLVSIVLRGSKSVVLALTYSFSSRDKREILRVSSSCTDAFCVSIQVSDSPVLVL